MAIFRKGVSLGNPEGESKKYEVAWPLSRVSFILFICSIFILNMLYSLKKKYYLKNPQVAIRWERRLTLSAANASTPCGKFNLLEH